MTVPTLPSTIPLSPSPVLSTAIVVAHVAAGGALAFVLGGTAGVAAGLLLAGLGAFAARRAGTLRGPRAPTCLTLRPAEPAELELRNGERLPVVARRVGRRWVSLASTGTSRRAFLITRDMTGADPFRLVRLWALWGRLPGAPTAPRTNLSR